MNIEMKKEQLTANRTVSEQIQNVTLQGDLIVPDKKPDIERVLQIDGRAVVTHREASGNKITVGGVAEFSILYLPDGDTMPVRCIKTTLPFRDVFETDCADDTSIRICTEADVSSIDFTMQNCRKLSLSATVTLVLKAYCQDATDIVCDIESDFPLQIRHKTVKTYSIAADTQTTITLPDKIEVPSGSHPVGEVLKMDATVSGQDVRVLSGKAIIKGNIILKTLYLAPTADAPVQFMEHELPFTEILDLKGVTEDMDCEVDYTVGSVYFETDDDAQSTLLGVEVTLYVHARAISTASVEVPDDCYSTSADIIPRICEKKIEYLAGTSKTHTAIRGSVNLPDDCPEIMQLYTVVAKPFIESTDNVNGDIIVRGTMDTYLLYMTADPALPLFSVKGEIPFEVTGDLQAGGADPQIECAVNLINCGFTVTDDRSVDIRANADVLIKLICKENVSLIEDITVNENEPLVNRASVVICFVKPDECLWDIAKRYKTTCENIAQTNGLDLNAPLKAGTPLIIS